MDGNSAQHTTIFEIRKTQSENDEFALDSQNEPLKHIFVNGS